MAGLLGIGRDRKMEALNAAAEVIETARGPVEYAIHGVAPYVLILHGTPQGHHASFIGEPLEEAGFGTITPSRPGYLRTPLATGRTFAEQADAAAALLDALEIDQVAVYGISGGGPSSIEFAARHPDRTRALVLEVAISQTYAPEIPAWTVTLFMNPVMFWLQAQLLRHAPRLVVSQFVSMESTHDAAERKRITADVMASPRSWHCCESSSTVHRSDRCERDSTTTCSSLQRSISCRWTGSNAQPWLSTAPTTATFPSTTPNTPPARFPAPNCSPWSGGFTCWRSAMETTPISRPRLTSSISTWLRKRMQAKLTALATLLA